jgi:hypothetical protein
MKSNIAGLIPAVSFVALTLMIAALCIYGVSVP